MSTYQLHQGSLPLLISAPHDGTQLPPGLAQRLTPSAQRLPDTDWHIARLYEFARDLGASMIVPHYSRYVVDLNRAADDASLYPGQNSTGLCPRQQFSGEAVYLDGQDPDAEEIGERIERYWRPYHEALATELARLRDKHGRVVLWEAHSIRSQLPFLFDGVLPVFNLGTAEGQSCSPGLARQLTAVLAAQDDYDHVVDGRFQGGYITRHYGQPAQGIEAVQMELAQRAYMDEEDFRWLPERGCLVQPILAALINRCLECAGIGA
ncbi:MAG: N-formylglutamate deformylase [Xanthomonadales bacterium]|nr:N-formylglutamate deformylase [Xanthomonadales bacterium]